MKIHVCVTDDIWCVVRPLAFAIFSPVSRPERKTGKITKANHQNAKQREERAAKRT